MREELPKRKAEVDTKPEPMSDIIMANVTRLALHAGYACRELNELAIKLYGPGILPDTKRGENEPRDGAMPHIYDTTENTRGTISEIRELIEAMLAGRRPKELPSGEAMEAPLDD